MRLQILFRSKSSGLALIGHNNDQKLLPLSNNFLYIVAQACDRVGHCETADSIGHCTFDNGVESAGRRHHHLRNFVLAGWWTVAEQLLHVHLASSGPWTYGKELGKGRPEAET